MTIKKLAFEIQFSLRKTHGIDLKRSHVHEVIAALFGFASFAALSTQRVLAQYEVAGPAIRFDVANAAARALGLGYKAPMPPLIAAVAAGAAEAQRLCVVSLDEVLAACGHECKDETPKRHADAAFDEDDPEDEGEDWEHSGEDDEPWLDPESSFLRESLLRLAEADNGPAHLALALLDEALDDEASDGSHDGAYWFKQQQSGRRLTGVELEWADTYRLKQEARSSRPVHLQRAAALGNVEAALRQAEMNPGDSAFELAVRLAGAQHAARLGRLAMACGRDEDARTWFRVAARQGDTSAMETLAAELEPELMDAWTWVHLARLLGTDVMAHDAVGDDGLPADADEAGAIYASGGFELDPLSDEDSQAAWQHARAIYEGIRA